MCLLIVFPVLALWVRGLRLESKSPDPSSPFHGQCKNVKFFNIPKLPNRGLQIKHPRLRYVSNSCLF